MTYCNKLNDLSYSISTSYYSVSVSKIIIHPYSFYRRRRTTITSIISRQWSRKTSTKCTKRGCKYSSDWNYLSYYICEQKSGGLQSIIKWIKRYKNIVGKNNSVCQKHFSNRCNKQESRSHTLENIEP